MAFTDSSMSGNASCAGKHPALPVLDDRGTVRQQTAAARRDPGAGAERSCGTVTERGPGEGTERVYGTVTDRALGAGAERSRGTVTERGPGEGAELPSPARPFGPPAAPVRLVPPAEAEAEKASNGLRGPEWWESYLARGRSGVILNTLANLGMILENDSRLRNIRWNELSGSIELTGDLPWRKLGQHGRFWREADDAHLMNYVETNYAPFSTSFYAAALLRVADNRAFHPVREYLKSISCWDGKERLDTLLVDWLSAEDSPYVRAVTRKTLVAAVRRAFHPGLKFDNILVLSGPQGIGKSTLIAHLGGDWYSDSLTISDMNDKTAAEKLQGYWILEIGEMAGMRKADLEKVKGFLSRQDDKFREAYSRRVTVHPRQCVFFGTTNKTDGYLRDVTGNRRFWTVAVTGMGEHKPWDLDPETVKQIWAEAVCHCDEPLVLPAELEETSREVQREALEKDDREGLVREYLQTPLPRDWSTRSIAERAAWYHTPLTARRGVKAECPRDRVSHIEIWCECFGRPRQDMTRRDSADIAAIMAAIPGWERAEKNERVGEYGTQRTYVRSAPLQLPLPGVGKEGS